jgi:hypothetical protein
MISRPAFSPADELQRCCEMLAKYWILAVPPALASLLIVGVVFATILTVVGSALAGGLLGGGHPGAGAGIGIGIGALVGLGGMLLGFVALNVAQAVTMHASLDAFADRKPDLGASFRAVLPRLGDLAVSMVATFLILLVPFVLCFVLIGIPLVIVAIFFTLYVQAAVIIGGEDGIGAIRTSIRLATQHVTQTVILALGVIAASIVGSFANTLVVHIPLVNLVAGFAIGGLTSAFVAMATARFYDVLRDMPPQSTITYAPPPPPPPPQATDYGGPPTIIR